MTSEPEKTRENFVKLCMKIKRKQRCRKDNIGMNYRFLTTEAN